uniref:Nematode cuticle collagen N-terminal domain-containing protein n=1 Tax=Parascaris equorum TaxID=6256 RepID=A0A914RYT2_PAREQ
MDLENRIKAYKFVAYSAVVFSAVAVLSVCVTLPMVYNYVHHVRRQMHNEINFCKESNRTLLVLALMIIASVQLSDHLLSLDSELFHSQKQLFA